MEASLDEDFVNFEAFSQTCASATLNSGADEEIRLLDNEARQRERRVQGEKLNGKDDNERISSASSHSQSEMKPPSQGMENGAESTALSSEYHIFTTFSYNSSSKKLTMIPVKYKIKEERRKVLKISVNKLKKIDDPESWLCRSVLINNTMKKLQKETRDEKINKQMSVMTQSKSFEPKDSENDEFGCQLSNNNSSNHDNNNDNNQNNKNTSNNNNNNNNNDDDDDDDDNDNNSSCSSSRSSSNIDEKVYRVNADEGAECLYQKHLGEEGFYKVGNAKSEEFLFQVDKAIENDVKSAEKMSHSEEDSEEDKLNSSISGGVSLNEDFVERIPSIKRCASRKKSVDEDGTADEILNLNESELVLNCDNTKGAELDDVDECDVHDVLSQLYMPPTPRMLTSIDSDTDDDELNVVDIDSSYIDSIKQECQKLPNEAFFDGSLLGGHNGDVKKEREGDEGDESPAKRRKVDDVFSCFNVCEESYDNFLCGNRNVENERTSEACKDSGKGPIAEEELIELEDEEDIKRRLSQSLSSHYHRKPDKTCDSFFEDNCDNQYSCGHTVTMFSDMQSVTFHNLIASLET